MNFDTIFQIFFAAGFVLAFGYLAYKLSQPMFPDKNKVK
jgi:hypothetical protein